MASAEKSGLDNGTIDLLTVAQALHWFDLESFYAEANRVLKESGLIAVWCYTLLEIAPEIDAIVNKFYDETVGDYWPPERRIVDARYENLPFPFQELRAPAFVMQASWSLQDLAGYLRTWSATQRFIAANGVDPVDSIMPDLLGHWKKMEEARLVTWPLALRVGRKNF